MRPLIFGILHRLATFSLVNWQRCLPPGDSVSNRKTIFGVSVLLLFGVFSVGALPQSVGSPLLLAMRQELLRSMENLKSQPMPPYFLSYEISESRSVSVHGAFGTILSSTENRSRLLNLDLRIGDPAFDNTHPIRGGSQFF
jgi:hypothetical protein